MGKSMPAIVQDHERRASRIALDQVIEDFYEPPYPGLAAYSLIGRRGHYFRH